MKDPTSLQLEQEEARFYGGFAEDFDREERRMQAQEDKGDMDREDQLLAKEQNDNRPH